MNLNIVIPLVASVVYAVLLFVVVRHGSRNKVNWAFALYLLVMSIWSFGSLMLHANFPVQKPLFWARLIGVSGQPMSMAFFYFIGVFLNIKRNRAWLYLCSGMYVVLFVANAMGYVVKEAYILEDGGSHIEFGPGIALLIFSIYFFLGFSIFDMITHYRRAKDRSYRNRIIYPLMGITIVLLGSLTNLTPLVKYPVDITANLINALLITYAILRHQLLDITLVIRKGLAYSTVTAGIAATYLLTVFLFERLARTILGYGAYLIPILVAVVVALALQPLRGRVQTWVDQLFFREKYDAQQMLLRLSRTAASILDLNVLSEMLLEEVTTTMHITGACILLKEQETGKFYLTAQRGLGKDVTDLRLRRDHPLPRWMVSEAKVLTAHEIGMLPQFKALWEEEKEDLKRLGAELFVPLLVKGDLVGLFTFGPKFSEEAIAHALATSARAMTILGQEKLEATIKFAQVDQARCVGCLTCVRTCPFHIPKIDPGAVGVGGIVGAAYIEPTLCAGCGTCTSECPADAIQLLHYHDDQIMVPDTPVLGQWLVPSDVRHET